MNDIYGDEPLKYLSQTPQRQRDEIHRLQGEVEALRRERDDFHMNYRMKCDVKTKALHEQLAAMTAERDEEKEKARVLRVENNTVRMDLAAMTAERDELERLYELEKK